MKSRPVATKAVVLKATMNEDTKLSNAMRGVDDPLAGQSNGDARRRAHSDEQDECKPVLRSRRCVHDEIQATGAGPDVRRRLEQAGRQC
jgi:hypothetical protein